MRHTAAIFVLLAGVSATGVICVAMFFPHFAKVTNNGELIILTMGGVVGLWIAMWRLKTADDTVKQERFKLGAELLDKG